jgi:hypothetical protein
VAPSPGWPPRPGHDSQVRPVDTVPGVRGSPATTGAGAIPAAPAGTLGDERIPVARRHGLSGLPALTSAARPFCL